MQNNRNGMVVLSVSLCMKLYFHPEMKVMLIHTAHISPLYTGTLQTAFRRARLAFWLFLRCWLIPNLMSIATVGVNLAWRIETSSFQNAKTITSSCFSLTWKQVQSYLVNLGQIHSYRSADIIFFWWINYSLKKKPNIRLVQTSHPRKGYSQRSCQRKVGVFQICNTISAPWTASIALLQTWWIMYSGSLGALLNGEINVTNASLFSKLPILLHRRKQCSGLHESSYFVSVIEALIKGIRGNSGCWAPHSL